MLLTLACPGVRATASQGITFDVAQVNIIEPVIGPVAWLIQDNLYLDTCSVIPEPSAALMVPASILGLASVIRRQRR